jgi:hypothetical protein
MSSSIHPSKLPVHLYGLHDIGGQEIMANAGRTGWLLDSVDVRAQTGVDYSSLSAAGFGVLVRLNHGSGAAGTIPVSYQYDEFAARCAAFVRNSPGAHIWLIGNEMNSRAARPEFPDGVRQVITPQKYAQCFSKCRAALKNLPGHASDLVIPGAIAPYNAETGDWVQYLIDILNQLRHQVDGIALHCYTHDFNADQITSDDTMTAPFNHRHFNFRAYRDFLNALPSECRALPVFITESRPLAGWQNANIGWIQAAYAEINAWNADPAHQPIQALILSRWQRLDDHPEWGIQDKRALVDDFQAALAAGYLARWAPSAPPAPPPPAPPPASPAYRVEWNETVSVPSGTMEANSALTSHVVVTNRGSQTWRARGANPVRLGYRWYNALGIETPVTLYPGNFSMRRNAAPGESVTFEQVELRAPQTPGIYTLKWDMVHEGITWFSARGSATFEETIRVTPPPPPPPPPAPPAWQVQFLAHDTPVSERAGQTTIVNLRLQNTGANTWSPGGTHPVHIGYKWFNAAGQPQHDVEDRRTGLPTEVRPNDQIAIGAILATPKTPGKYQLRWDLVAEGITWFADAGGAPLVIPVSVTTLPVDVSGWRAEASIQPAQVALALDGDPRTFWDSGAPQTPRQWFRLNLGTPRMIDGVQFLSPGKGFPAGYALRASGDGATWQELARVAADNAQDVVAIFAPQPIRYLQIDLLCSAPVNWMISQILVHSATAWIARTSHNAAAAHHAIDNRPETAWTSGAPQTPGMWFQIDLGRVETISGLRLDAPADASPVSFRITTWNAAASRWQIAYEVKNNRAPVDLVFSPTQTQFINLQLLAASDQPWTIQRAHVIREMEMWLGSSR